MSPTAGGKCEIPHPRRNRRAGLLPSPAVANPDSCPGGILRRSGDSDCVGDGVFVNDLERRAVAALQGVRTNSSFDRYAIKAFFKREKDKKLTKNQVWRLWILIYTYRRQIEDSELLNKAKEVEEAPVTQS